MPIPTESCTRYTGIAVSPVIPSSLLPGWDRHGTYRRTRQVMSTARGITHSPGYLVRQPAAGGTLLVTGHRSQPVGAGR